MKVRRNKRTEMVDIAKGGFLLRRWRERERGVGS